MYITILQNKYKTTTSNKANEDFPDAWSDNLIKLSNLHKSNKQLERHSQ
jgi:hypothetical protein